MSSQIQPDPGRWIRLACLAPLLALQSCAGVGPDYQRPELYLPSSWTSAPPHAGDTPADLAVWWRHFGDPILSALIEDSLRSAPDLRSARARLQEARARSDLAAAQTLPSVGASLTASRRSGGTGNRTSQSLYQAGFDAHWELDLFGGLRRGAEAAQADLQASEYGLAAVQTSLAAEIARNYVELRAYQARLAIAKANLAGQEETLQLTAWRAQSGLASEIDLQRARSQAEQTRALIPTLMTQAALCQNRLATLLGRTPDQIGAYLGTTTGIPSPAETVALAIPATVLQQRPDVQAAERRLAAETARIGQRLAARYPGLNLSGSLGLEALSVAGLGGAPLSRSLVAGLSALLFDGGRLRQQVAIQSAIQEQALVQYETAVLTALEEVENALATLNHLRQRQSALVGAARAAGEAAQLARQRYAAGLIDFQTVLDTERTRLSAEDGLLATQADLALAAVQLYKALGGGWQPGGISQKDSR